MKVFVDHVGHADLYYSMHALFERRLGWELYRPIGGPDWNESGLKTAVTLPSYAEAPVVIDDITRIGMPIYNYSQRCITWNQFQEMDFDVLVSTSWDNEIAMVHLGEKYHPKGIVVRQIANIGEGPVLATNVILGTLTPMAAGINWIKSCPEHLDSYEWVPPVEEKLIKSFSSHLISYPVDWTMYHDFENELSEFKFKMHGARGIHHSIAQQDMPEAIKTSMFIWHTKGNGGGGYIPRQALNCGKPLIVNKSYCKIHKTLCLEILEDGLNCIDINPAHRPKQASLNLIREWSRPDVYPERCRIAYQSFLERVNFQREAEAIKQWIYTTLNRNN